MRREEYVERRAAREGRGVAVPPGLMCLMFNALCTKVQFFFFPATHRVAHYFSRCMP